MRTSSRPDSRRRRAIQFLAIFLLVLASAGSDALDSPHTNIPGYGIECGNCHWTHASTSPPWATAGSSPDPADDTINNRRCYICHDGSKSIIAAKTHSTSTTSSSYWNTQGGWKTECVTCHDPHQQRQTRAWRSFSFVSTGPPPLTVGPWNTSTGNWTTVTVGNAITGNYIGYYFLPDRNYPFYYEVLDDTSGRDSFRVKGGVLSAYVKTGGYAFVYGKNVRDYINYTNPATQGVGGSVKIIRPEGTNGPGDSSNAVTSVCYVCHTRTTHWSTVGDTSHNDRSACTSCHPHLMGFKPSCKTCHNGPPTTGKHAVHFGTGSYSYGGASIVSSPAAYGFDCGICHNGGHMNTADNPHTVEVIFAGIAVQDPASGTATYAPGANSVDDPGTGSTFNYSDGTCSNVYCHGNYPGSGKKATVTYNTGAAPCGSCHDASNTSPPASGTHAMHADSDAHAFRCTLCHNGIVSGSGPDYTIADKSRHVSGYVDWQFDSADPRGAGASYSIASGTAVPSNGSGRAYGACTTVYCHSNVQPEGGMGGPSSYAAPTWGSSMRDCTACHGSGGDRHVPNMSSGSHATHMAYDLTVASSNLKCVICHTWNSLDTPSCAGCHNFSITPAFPKHANYEVNVAFAGAFSNGATTYSGTPAPGDGYGACANTYCHSNGTSVSTGTISSNSTPNWGSGSLTCSSCHDYAPSYDNGSPKANSHGMHVVHSVGDCSNCHYGTTTTGTTITDKTRHVNKTYDLQAKPGYSFTYSYAADGGTCSSNACHSGTAKWGSGGGGANCITCHGHDAGYEYESGKFSQGRGTFMAHSTHTENDADDRKGPNVNCDSCHDTANFPLFKDGKDLAHTTACDPCHSEGGDYRGVSDSVIGAKANWKTGVYEADSLTLKAGKERWCAGCHDGTIPEGTASVINGIAAPNVIGDEDGAYTYGTGWGYYKTGHGLPSDKAYPASGGITAGVGAACGGCHDLSLGHIDGNARTFDDGDTTSDKSSEYRQGYRLKLIDGQNPMIVPKTGTTDTANFRLCVSCHTNTSAYTEPNSTQTNFRDTSNRHYYHLDATGWRFSADWDGAYTSRITCITCHNVHGSTRLAMIRDGKLIGREPGIQIWYWNSGISTNTNPPFPEDLPLSASTGLIWIPGSSGNVCFACHGGPTREIFGPRGPFQPTAQAPVLDWTGENGYVSDGAAPDSAASGSSFTFRVKYTDYNNDAPSVIELRIDADNNGAYESTYTMTGINDADSMYINGKIYTRTLTLTNAGGNIISYRFYAKDTTDREAIGPATGGGSITLTALALSNPPVLAWVSGPCRFEGLSPAAGVSPTTFDFRVQYTDADNNAPTIKQVWVDLNDDGDYDDAGEKQDMTLGGGDGDYRDGEVFTKGLALNYAGDGKINYRFVFSDGTHAASGDPANDHKATVVDSAATRKTVCASGCDHTTIQGAVDAVNGAHTVLVYAGTYNERVYFNGSNDNDTIVRSVCGSDDTIISASGVTPAYGIEVTGSTGSVVDGFGITGGTIGVYLHHGSANTNITIENCKVHDNAGSGGIFSGDHSSITVNNTEIYSNTTTLSGAGIYLMEGVSSINDTIIRDNHAAANGGGVATGLWNSSAFTKTTIKNNLADGSGGGFAQTSDSSTAAFNKSTILGNTATTGSGGGLYIQGEGGTYGVSLTNSVVTDNQAASGGGIYLDGNLSAVNCTIADNKTTGATGGGGAIYANTGGSVTIRNSILWNNVAPAVGSRHIAYLSSTTLTTISDSILNNDGGTTFNRYPYIVVQDGGSLPTIEGFVSGADPFFVDAANGDYHIRSTSPAIDQASPAYAPADDIDGDTRPQGTAPDIGADEYRSATSNSAPVLAWTGEVNYTADGVNPDSGDVTTGFNFRVDYSDAENEAPVQMQVWIDRNDDEAYSDDEKYSLTATDSGDIIYTDGKRYAGTLTISYSGDGELNYRFFATDGRNDAAGAPTSDRTVTLSNAVPSLSWTGETDYSADGVNPDSALGGGDFEFRVDYTDADNVAPSAIQVWVDKNDDGDYADAGEKIDMDEADAGDTDYTNGKRYTRALNIYYAGNGALNYRFYAKDSSDEATGAPSADAVLTVTNNTPALAWTGEANYTTDGVHPESATTGSSFEFRVDYSDADNTSPSLIQAWVDANDDGDYDDAGEKIDMTAADPGDGNYADGKRYAKALNIYYAGDGILNYRFHAGDGSADAVGPPTSDRQLTVTAVANNAPLLSWATAGCLTEGVRPRTGAVNADFEFRVIYSDADGQCPTSMLVNVNGTPYDLTGNDGASCQTGRTYYRSIPIAASGDLNYSFSASDGISLASGSPVTNHVVSVINTTFVVRPSGGTYSTIQAAVNASGDPSTILVYPNSDFTAATYGAVSLYTKPNRTIQSVCGRDLTTISGGGTAVQGVVFSGAGGDVLDGFSVTGGTSYGVYTQTAPSAIKNCNIYGNPTGIYANGSVAVTIDNNRVYNNTSRGVNSTNSIVNIANCEISVNGSDTANTPDGAGLYISGGTGTHTITGTVIKDNKTTRGTGTYGRGGGVMVQNAANAAFSRVTITGNESTDYQGGGVFLMTTGTVTFENAIIADNSAGTQGGGAYIQSGGNGSFINVTLADNEATNGGGAIFLNTQPATVRNSIFWNNTAPSGRNIQRNASGNCGTMTGTDVTTGAGWTDNCTFTDITGNMTPAQDPLFAGGSPYDYHIQSGSPCRDAIPAAGYNGPAGDIDGNSRPYNTDYDMGADEYVP